MGNLFSGSTTTRTNERFDSGPSSFQRPYLDQSFGAARDIYNQTRDTPYYQGSTYAGMSDEQRAGMGRMSEFANGAGFDMGQQISGIGSQIVGQAGNNAMTNLERFTSMAGEDGTAANIAAATRYADNPHVQGMIDANARDINRNLYENEIPGIDRAASATGNINSSRAGIAAGVAQRGAADRIGDISASIRGDAYNRGLSMAQQDRQSTMDAYGRAAGMYSDMTSRGIDAMRSGTDLSFDALGRGMDVLDREQRDRQGYLDEAFRRWDGEDRRQMDLLSRYHSIIGSNSWGQSGTSSGTSTQRQSGNIFGQIAGAAASAASIAASACDRRLKRNILLLGRHSDGLGIYSYTYDQDMALEYGLDLPKGFQIGPMADEVAELRPHAMGPTLNGGFASINLAAL